MIQGARLTFVFVGLFVGTLLLSLTLSAVYMEAPEPYASHALAMSIAIDASTCVSIGAVLWCMANRL